jgi:hypothetical protein
MRTFRPLIVFAAASVAVMLTVTLPAQAQEGWRRRGTELAERDWRRQEWQEQQWRQAQWRQREEAREWASRNQQRWYQPPQPCYGFGCNFLR